MGKKIKCRRCGKQTEYSPENKFRPFCSERCQLIDLGEWASEKYAVPVENNTPSEENMTESNPSPSDNDDGNI
jgi:uncharacterized protein